MAYFKLSLLTYQFEDNQSFLLQDVISEFNTQENVYNSKQADQLNYSLESRKYSFCYSYDEKFSLTQNAQKTLTFNMDKFIIKEDLREENPFARNIIIGSQLLLVDQYGNNYFFTVKSIDYDIKETNITYKISCQDTFSYQMTRQNAGYTIDNDSSGSDFIGAKTVDWWTINKIIPECHIGYNYLYMNDGLYEAEDGSYRIFSYNENLSNVKRIIKDAYSPEKDKDLYETIPFSCSGSNANAALISLGETLDLQLKTFENIGQFLNKDYEQIEYIESDGSQYIDTGFIYTPRTKVVMDIQLVGEIIPQKRLFGMGYNQDDGTKVTFESYINGGSKWARATSDGIGNWQGTGIDADNDRHTIILDNNRFKVLSGTRTIYNQENNATITRETNTVSLVLLCRSGGTSGISAKLYGCKIFDNSILVRDLVPVIRKADNKVGMYDKVNNTFYSNLYSSLFVAGPNKKDSNLTKYFWFEPKKNTNRIGGLVYSPYNSIQSFGLGHKGDSLTTILNVEGPTYDDEIITLIPALTPHFSNFINDTSWNNHYKKGMFIKQCEPQHYVLDDKLENDQTIDKQFLYYSWVWNRTSGTYNILDLSLSLNFENTLTYDSTTGFIYIKLCSDPENSDSIFKFDPLFTKISFNSGGISRISGLIQPDIISFNSNTNLWALAIVKNSTEVATYTDGEDLSKYATDEAISVFLKIFIGTGKTGNLEFRTFEPNLSFYREVSQEDIEFAQAAEECPWLENKLIDFNYFLESKMITPEEYRNLMNSLTQDLRIINGKLMFHAKAYYKALHDRTKLLADLTNQLDVLGAAANADIVTTLRTKGEITEDSDIHSFSNAYRDLILSDIINEEKLLNYDDILTDYFNKFFNSEQRYLKNIKKFKDYFNSLPSTWLDPTTGFYNYTLTIENPSNTSYIISNNFSEEDSVFSGVNSEEIQYIQTGDKAGIPIFQIYDKNTKKPYNPVTAENFRNYYIQNGDGSGKVDVEENEIYNKEWVYYNKANNELIPDIAIKRALAVSNSLKYRDVAAEDIHNFSYPETGPLSTITNVLKSFWSFKIFTQSDYKHNFPITEAYYDNDKKVLFVNSSTVDNFYKLTAGKYWFKTSLSVNYDIFGNLINGFGQPLNANALLYSSVIPNEGVYTKTTGTEWLKPTMGISYTYAKENTDGISFYYKDTSWFKTLRKTSIISKNRDYRVFEFWPDITESAAKTFFNNNSLRGTITYWPIFDRLKECDIIRHGLNQTNSMNLQDLLSGWATLQSSTDYIWVPNANCPFTHNFIIVEVTNYKIEDCTSTIEYEDDTIFVDTNNVIEDFSNMIFPNSIAYTNEQGQQRTATTFYHKVDSHAHPTKDDIFDLDKEYYQQDADESYSRIFTAKQLEEERLTNQSYTTLSRYIITNRNLTPYETKYIVPLQKITYIMDADGISDVIKSKIQDYTIYFTTDEIHNIPSIYIGNNNIIYDCDDDEVLPSPGHDYKRNAIPYLCSAVNNSLYQTTISSIEDESVNFKLTKIYTGPIDIDTNGQLWYQCTKGTLSSLSYAVNIAAAIEAELEQYWQQAYTASLYCRYFLPESWQMTYSKDQNLFSNDITGLDESNHIYLKNIYIPDVSIYSQDGKTILPKYYIKRGRKKEYQVEDRSIDSESNIGASTFITNPVICEFIKYLEEEPENFFATTAGNTTYYYIDNKDKNSGCTWSQLMLKKVGTEYTDYSGHYDLAYRLIKKHYLPLFLDEYERLKYQKQVLWDTLYQTYGYLMLEQNYKDETSTTSSELMTLAKYAFKDYSAPERQYNITVIDSTSLKGYKGEEIRVGDGIQIDAQAYYNEYDQIFKSLSQYLFITDISYTLRSPTDISLTVNSIKYQDKLIQRLVKLIK